MIKRIVIALLLATTLTGCIGSLFGVQNCEPTRVWSHTEKGQNEFFYDKFVCLHQSQFNGPESQVGVNWRSFNECMTALGYKPAPVE